MATGRASRTRRRLFAARALISDPANELIFSVASLWEVAIKHSRGLPEFQVDPVLLRNSLLQNGFNELEIVGRHAVRSEITFRYSPVALGVGRCTAALSWLKRSKRCSTDRNPA